MKGRNLLLTGLVNLLIGILLIIFRTSLSNGRLVILIGAIFLIAGVINMTVLLGSRDKNGKARSGIFGTTFGWIASTAAVVMGLAMIIFCNDFVAMMGFVFGVLILFAALFQLFLLIFGSRPVTLSPWFYLVPAALVGAAIYIILNTPETGNHDIVMIVTGISFIVFGAFTIIEGTAIGQANRQTRISQKNEEKKIVSAENDRKDAENSTEDSLGDDHNKI